MSVYKTRNILVGLLIFLGVGALFGGSTLVLSPSGTLLGLPINLLKNAPFDNYLILGII